MLKVDCGTRSAILLMQRAGKLTMLQRDVHTVRARSGSGADVTGNCRTHQKPDIHNSILKINQALKFCRNVGVYLLQSSDAKLRYNAS